jgi:hypothetical protein
LILSVFKTSFSVFVFRLYTYMNYLSPALRKLLLFAQEWCYHLLRKSFKTLFVYRTLHDIGHKSPITWQESSWNKIIIIILLWNCYVIETDTNWITWLHCISPIIIVEIIFKTEHVHFYLCICFQGQPFRYRQDAYKPVLICVLE